ncbi:MAG: transporter associated domain-containing protein [Methylicorpusculum sp.]|uniref:HlyC/CorC family transporter n=1 Tax=Methylicorpusculum sp. TaxID=2713644 RepID=UPI002718D0B3|nr:transporter associated domain-containing protein [Methylicorpusculum sp.]MDO8842947.1 transporter associated domain-containing protein [Methylicorpusculum sp.]MDO8940139.1 transporter associated domain-containing protein [Methylicorpusculum sp.]MDO9241393.1 transporter associated domain-containing protein [Methylicorpusculum sp.]MDP2179534.1 transporter associated domain-containing protein [Methylicorpusculum sp.]MDP2204489.1 transporter associated domain-containing protein [Methylicorpuscu
MSEESPHSSNGGTQKSWLSKIGQMLSGDPQDQEDLMDILREAKDNHLIDSDAFAMIEGVMEVSEMRVRDIMIPRVQMVVVPHDAELKSILPLVLEHGHSRFPVIEDDRSKVVGVLLAKDLLSHILSDLTIKIEEIMRPVSVVPESKRLNILLKEFRTNRNHMAIVVDEYGAAAGLVTIEDVLEQIVGEIEDEHDLEGDEEDYIFRRSDAEYTVKALTPIEDFDEYFSTDFATDEYDTVGGFIVTRLGHLPKKGEKVVEDRFRFEVLKADSRRIHLLKVKILDNSDE